MNNRLLFAILIFVLSFSFCSPKPSSQISEEELRSEILTIITDSGGEVGLAFKDLETDQILLINEREMMHAASTMKVPVLIEVYKQAEEGRFSLDDSLVVRNEFRSIVDGSPYSMGAESDSDTEIYGLIGDKIPIRELIRRMIALSSNLATNLVIDLVEAKNVMSTLNNLGVSRMKVLRGVQDIKAFEEGLSNLTDAFDMMLVMEAIAQGKAVSKDASQEMIKILAQQKFKDKIPAGLPPGIRVVNKTGSITEVDHDAAIVFPEGRKPYVLVVLTRGIPNHKKAQELIASLSRLIYSYIHNSSF